jgi:hypothetical protein
VRPGPPPALSEDEPPKPEGPKTTVAEPAERA